MCPRSHCALLRSRSRSRVIFLPANAHALVAVPVTNTGMRNRPARLCGNSRISVRESTQQRCAHRVILGELEPKTLRNRRRVIRKAACTSGDSRLQVVAFIHSGQMGRGRLSGLS